MIWETVITRQQPHAITLATPSNDEGLEGEIESTLRIGPGNTPVEIGMTLASVLRDHRSLLVNGDPMEVLAAAITCLADASTVELSGAERDFAMAADVYLESLKPPSAER